MSCELGENPNHPTCPRDDQGCVTQGTPLHWQSSCLNYAVQVDGSPRSQLDADQIQALADQAFLVWKTAKCPGGGSPNFDVHFQGYVSCDRAESVCGSADVNVNVLMFHDSDWPYGSSDVGVTTPTGGSASGLVVDTDVEIDSQVFGFESDASGMMKTSLLYTLAHEFGHFLGLAHSRVPGALMTPVYQSLPVSQNPLSADDTAAICEAFPPGPALGCVGASTPAYDQCRYAIGEPPPKCDLASLTQDASGCGCQLAESSNRLDGASIAALSVLLGALVRRRRVR